MQWKVYAFFSPSPSLYFPIMNIYFYNGKEIKFMFKEEAAPSPGVMNTAAHTTHWTQMSPPGAHSCAREVTGQGAEGKLAFPTPQEERMQVPFRARPDFPPGQASEGIYRPRGIQTSVLHLPAALTSPVGSRQSAMQSAVPFRLPQMPPLC